MKVRFAKEIGTRCVLRIYWGDKCANYGYHNATVHLADSDKLHDWEFKGRDPSAYPAELWPTKCDQCGENVPHSFITKQVFYSRLYDTPSGKLGPGDMYWNDWLDENHYWDNHKGPHLEVICPNGHPWNIDSRASNCGLPGDRMHRCWVRHGEPPNIHVDKNGLTCSAGGGSIIAGNYHGFLHNGSFHE